MHCVASLVCLLLVCRDKFTRLAEYLWFRIPDIFAYEVFVSELCCILICLLHPAAMQRYD